jgi:hypothetical protein
VLDSVDLEGAVSRIMPVQNAIVSMPEPTQPGKVIGEIVQPTMNDDVGIEAELLQTADDGLADL